ncbi:putative DD41D transposase [Trichonephila clavipes]|nr:putative DD41D transposase [Trichonephila clavipes]
MNWPACSDLNSIEYVGDALEKHMAARSYLPENNRLLKQMFLEDWQLLHHELLDNLVLRLNKSKRLQLTKEHAYWAVDDREIYMCFNESRFGWEQLWRKQNASVVSWQQLFNLMEAVVCALLVEWLHQQKKTGIWSEANPQVYVETPLYPEKLTVWCALWAGGIIGPYFFKNDEGQNVKINGNRYRAMITNFFIPELNNYDAQELWLKQDGATCHTARATIDLLKDTFGDRLISRFGPVNWRPRSCDLTPLDYFLWGYVKSLVYADKPQTLDHLEDNICRVIVDIRPQMFGKVIENWTSRLDYIQASRGSHMQEIIF